MVGVEVREEGDPEFRHRERGELGRACGSGDAADDTRSGVDDVDARVDDDGDGRARAIGVGVRRSRSEEDDVRAPGRRALSRDRKRENRRGEHTQEPVHAVPPRVLYIEPQLVNFGGGENGGPASITMSACATSGIVAGSPVNGLPFTHTLSGVPFAARIDATCVRLTGCPQIAKNSASVNVLAVGDSTWMMP